MSDKEILFFEQIEELFKKIETLPENIINAVIKKIIDKLIELRIQHPSVEFFNDKVKHSFSICELDVNKCTPCDSSSPLVKDIGKELNIIIKKEGNDYKSSQLRPLLNHNIIPYSYCNKPLKQIGCDESGEQQRKSSEKMLVDGTKKDCELNEKVLHSSRFPCRKKRFENNLVKRNCIKSTTIKRGIHIKRHTNQQDFPCNLCDYKAFTKMEKKVHMRMHAKEKTQICHFCGKTYTKESTLRKHILSIHECSNKQHCPQCDFTTYHSNSLRVHIKIRHHGELNNFVCPVCGGKVKLRSAFLEHMRSHTGEKPFSCDECNSSFACASRLNAHKKSVHAPRNFRCLHCSKAFQTKHHMLRHQTIHTNEKPYGCPFCSYVSNTHGNLTKHVRLIHHAKEYSYRKQKSGQEYLKLVKEEWISKGQKFTEEYLKSLSEKLGQDVTVDELRRKEDEKRKTVSVKVQKAKLRNSKYAETYEHSYSSNKQVNLPGNATCAFPNEKNVSILPTSASSSALLLQVPNNCISDSTVNEVNFHLGSSEGQVIQVLQTHDTLPNSQFIQIDCADDLSRSPMLTGGVCSLVSHDARNNSIAAREEICQFVPENSVHLCVNSYSLEDNIDELGVQIHLEEAHTAICKNSTNVLTPSKMDSNIYSKTEERKTDCENTVFVIIKTDDATAAL